MEFDMDRDIFKYVIPFLAAILLGTYFGFEESHLRFRYGFIIGLSVGIMFLISYLILFILFIFNRQKVNQMNPSDFLGRLKHNNRNVYPTFNKRGNRIDIYKQEPTHKGDVW